jgi:type VI secretion system protein ImpM
MNPHHSPPERVGWFGKIPALGDFVTRHLPPSFVQPWDEWLSAELSEARLLLADTWAETYQHAPTTCFSLSAGVVDERAWQGILVPSFDRVGRQFPLTVALSSAPRTVATRTLQWWAELVTTGRRALEPGCDAQALDEALTAFVSRQAAFMRHSGTDDERLQRELATLVEGTSAWWPWRSEDRIDPVLSRIAGLPRGAAFRHLLSTRHDTVNPPQVDDPTFGGIRPIH